MNENISNGNKIKKTNTPRMILVVEDDEGLSRLIQKTLQREGFQTESAINGTEAVAIVVNNQNVVMLLDYRLPDMSGKQVIVTLAERQCGVPFVIMTGHGDVPVAVEMMKLGARDYLLKDSDFLDILPSVVNRVVNQLEIEKKLNKAEEEIREARDFLENIFKTTADGIIVTDNEGFITMVNDAVEEITGYSKDELLKQHVTLLTPTDKQHYSKGEHEIHKLVQEGNLKEGESLLKRKDGQCIIIETNRSLLFDK